MTAVERAARAEWDVRRISAKKVFGIDILKPWDEMPKHWQEEAIGCMRAAIASLREPTPAMLRAWFDDTGAINEFSARAWERGIDAILTETEEGAARD